MTFNIIGHAPGNGWPLGMMTNQSGISYAIKSMGAIRIRLVTMQIKFIVMMHCKPKASNNFTFTGRA
jgi:hypothetical protein